MVNTFIVHRPTRMNGTPDYSASAAELDDKRLFKQIIEAEQILRVLVSRHHIAHLMGLDPCPADSPSGTEAFEWVKSVSKAYLASEKVYVIDGENKLRTYDRKAEPYHVTKGDVTTVNRDGSLTVWLSPKRTKVFVKRFGATLVDENVVKQRMLDLTRGSRMRVRVAHLLEAERWVPNDWEVYSRGHCYHPACVVWAGHERELCLYIRAHHAEQMRRKPGCALSSAEHFTAIKPPQDSHVPPLSSEGPWWVYKSSIVTMTHRASLRRKLPAHYEPKFAASDWDTCGYFWPSSLADKHGVGARPFVGRILLGKYGCAETASCADSEWREFMERACHPILRK